MLAAAFCIGITGLIFGTILVSSAARARRNQAARDYDTQTVDLVSTFGQELRTPLTSIVGFAEMLSDGDLGTLDDEQRRVIDIVHRNATRLSELVSRVP